MFQISFSILSQFFFGFESGLKPVLISARHIKKFHFAQVLELFLFEVISIIKFAGSLLSLFGIYVNECDDEVFLMQFYALVSWSKILYCNYSLLPNCK